MPYSTQEVFRITRDTLIANRTYYVDPTSGSDTNDGLSPGAGAFATIQKGIDTVASLDISTFDVTIQLADDTYLITDSNRVVCKPYVTGGGVAKIVGNNSTPANVLLRAEAGFTLTHDSEQGMFDVVGGSCWEVSGIALSNLNSVSATTINRAIQVKEQSRLTITDNLTFINGSATVTMQCLAAVGGSICDVFSPAVITFDSGANGFQLGFIGDINSAIDMKFGASSGDITFAGSNNFTFAYVFLRNNSLFKCRDVVYTGTLTTGGGTRYDGQGNTTIFDNGNVPTGASTDSLLDGAVSY